jgi:hypothetical protein
MGIVNETRKEQEESKKRIKKRPDSLANQVFF